MSSLLRGELSKQMLVPINILAKQHPEPLTMEQLAVLCDIRVPVLERYVAALREAGYLTESNGLIAVSQWGLRAAEVMPKHD